MTSEWDAAAGIACGSCGVESFQLLDGKCMRCAREEAIVGEEELEEKGRKENARQALRQLVDEVQVGNSRAALLKATCYRCSGEAALAVFRPTRGRTIGRLVCNGCGTYAV